MINVENDRNPSSTLLGCLLTAGKCKCSCSCTTEIGPGTSLRVRHLDFLLTGTTAHRGDTNVCPCYSKWGVRRHLICCPQQDPRAGRTSGSSHGTHPVTRLLEKAAFPSKGFHDHAPALSVFCFLSVSEEHCLKIN